MKRLEKEMLDAARNLEFERAAQLRDQLKALKERLFGVEVAEEPRWRRRRGRLRHEAGAVRLHRQHLPLADGRRGVHARSCRTRGSRTGSSSIRPARDDYHVGDAARRARADAPRGGAATIFSALRGAAGRARGLRGVRLRARDGRARTCATLKRLAPPRARAQAAGCFMEFALDAARRRGARPVRRRTAGLRARARSRRGRGARACSTTCAGSSTLTR